MILGCAATKRAEYKSRFVKRGVFQRYDPTPTAIKLSNRISFLLSVNRKKFWRAFKEFCDDNGS